MHMFSALTGKQNRVTETTGQCEFIIGQMTEESSLPQGEFIHYVKTVFDYWIIFKHLFLKLCKAFKCTNLTTVWRMCFKKSTLTCDYKPLVRTTFSLFSISSKIASTVNWRSSTRMNSLLSCGPAVCQGTNSRDSFLKDLCKSFQKEGRGHNSF